MSYFIIVAQLVYIFNNLRNLHIMISTKNVAVMQI